MKIFRYMSKKEFDKLIKGELLKNNKHHQGHTNSVGFCFMKVDDNEPRYAYKFLSGVVDDDVCVVFETNKKLTKSYGVYADPYGSFFATITEDEYCTKEYSIEDFKIIKMTIPDFWKEEWEWETDINKIVKKLDKIEKEKLEEEKQQKIKNKLQEDFEKEQSAKLLDFYKQVNEERKIEIKIGDKYYKMPCVITEIVQEPSMFRTNINIKFETWLDK